MHVCFFNDTATTEIYTLSLHDALPIWVGRGLQQDERGPVGRPRPRRRHLPHRAALAGQGAREVVAVLRHDHGLAADRSEEHTSELQSRQYLVCRLLLEKKKTVHYRCTS